MQSDYILQKTDKSHCPGCHKHVDLLCSAKDMLTAFKRGREHWFYICWNCERVFELGRGEVLRLP